MIANDPTYKEFVEESNKRLQKAMTKPQERKTDVWEFCGLEEVRG